MSELGKDEGLFEIIGCMVETRWGPIDSGAMTIPDVVHLFGPENTIQGLLCRWQGTISAERILLYKAARDYILENGLDQ